MVFWLVALVCIDGVERTTSTNALEDVCGAGGTTVAVAADAEVVVPKSLTTGTADDLCALGTLWKVSVVGLSFLFSTSS